MDELAKVPQVAAAYDQWYALREDVLRGYKDEVPPRLPLSQQKEFKPIRNMVIAEAVQMMEAGDLTEQLPNLLVHQERSAESACMSSSRLLNGLAKLFADNMPPLPPMPQMGIDHKRLQNLRQKGSHKNIGLTLDEPDPNTGR